MVAPGLYPWAYPSSMVSKYHCWFRLMGYKELDIYVEEDGTWYIIQYYTEPLIPSQTQWQPVLGPMRNVEISFGFCQKYVKELDITRKAFWAREEAKTAAVDDEHAATERHAQDLAARATKAVMKNDGLVQRIAKNGLKEMDLLSLAKRVPRSEIVKPLKGVKQDVPSTSKPTVEAI